MKSVANWVANSIQQWKTTLIVAGPMAAVVLRQIANGIDGDPATLFDFDLFLVALSGLLGGAGMKDPE